ncbi:replication initiator protein A [Lactococcus lactis]|uniref:Transposase n=1 Tax=Lactococcus lactis TaxID=1358 RepID=A0AAW5TRH6_9LACT|nr:replication initiator protein A [Lactococcus lactis]MCW2280179.1 transposase [Lactococcus lactis]
MADYTVNDLENWSYYQYPKLFLSQRSNAYLKNEYGDYIRDEQGNKIITHKVRETSSYAQMSDKAKTLYMILFDRLCLSFKTNQELIKSGVSSKNLDFVDSNGATYIIFSYEELMDRMDIGSRSTISKLKKELLEQGLLREQRMGINKPNRLYPQKLDEQRKIIERRDLETDQLIDCFDYQGQRIEMKKSVESPRLTGSPKNGLPKSGLLEVQKVYGTKPEYKQIDKEEEEEEAPEKNTLSLTELETSQEEQLVQEKQEALKLKYGEAASQMIDEAVLSTHQNLKNAAYYWTYLLKALDNAEALFKLKQAEPKAKTPKPKLKKKDIPNWSHPHYENHTTEEELAQLERIKRETLEKLAAQ